MKEESGLENSYTPFQIQIPEGVVSRITVFVSICIFRYV